MKLKKGEIIGRISGKDGIPIVIVDKAEDKEEWYWLGKRNIKQKIHPFDGGNRFYENF